MEFLVEKRKEQIEVLMFNSEKLFQVENSLYRVGTEEILIPTADEPETDYFFFSMNPVYLKRAKYTIFLCEKEGECIAFKIPSEILRELSFCEKGNGRPKTTIQFSEETISYYLTFKMDSQGYTELDIQDYMFELTMMETYTI